MQKYELIYVLRVDQPEAEVQARGDKAAALIAEHKGEVTERSHWGVRKMAYQIDHQGQGDYTFFKFRSEGTVVVDFHKTDLGVRKAGQTQVVHESMEGFGVAAVDAGMRAVCGQTVMKFPAPDAASYEDSLQMAREFIERWKDHPLIVPAVAPHAPYTCTAEILRATAGAEDVSAPGGPPARRPTAPTTNRVPA